MGFSGRKPNRRSRHSRRKQKSASTGSSGRRLGRKCFKPGITPRPFLFQLNFRLIPGKEAAPGDESKIFLRFFRDIESDLSGFFRVRVYRLQEKPERLAAPVVDPWINLTIRFIF